MTQNFSESSNEVPATPMTVQEDGEPVAFEKTGPSPITAVANGIRGGLIGLAELVPGVSGGTIALVTGVYERVLYNVNVFLDGVKTLPKDRVKARRRLLDVDWWMLIPMLIGMAAIVIFLAGPMKDFVSNQPVVARSLFLGMVAASIAVPLTMIHWREPEAKPIKVVVAMAIFAVLTFFGTGFTSTPQENPNLIIVFLAAAVAVCALVLPGVSGSFFLLAVGLYEAVLGAVDDRNLVFIGVFALGAITGVVLFARLLEKLLNNYRTVTLSAMAGLLLGSLRALWPWQSSDADLLAPSDQVGTAVLMAIVGVVVVVVMIVVERRFGATNNTPKGPQQDPEEWD